jgi:cyanophycinase
MMGSNPGMTLDPRPSFPPDATPPRGRLVLHGGGHVDPALRRRWLDMVGGPGARVAVVPQASAVADNWQASLDVWREAGSRAAELLDLTSPHQAVTQIERADLVWLSSGDQVRLVTALAATPVADVLRRRYRHGLVVGGVSAGMAALSGVMITGEPADPVSGATHVAAGLGLWPEVILDQHLLARQRLGRLMRAVVDHPALIGVGVDEGTAIVVDAGRRFVVEGRSHAVVVWSQSGGVETQSVGPGEHHVLGSDEVAAG